MLHDSASYPSPLHPLKLIGLHKNKKFISYITYISDSFSRLECVMSNCLRLIDIYKVF